MNKDVNGFIKAQGKKLVNGEDQEILLRGVGLGSWLVPEGYMWRFPSQGDRPRRIEKMIKTLIGKEKSELFWETYYLNYISEADIRQIAQEGFNSLRIPINSRFLLEEEGKGNYKENHLKILDTVIQWCLTYQVYVILDLHGAPGGQTGSNIDDSEEDRPQLFMHEENKEITVDLWRKLAERYKDEWIVAGYDLLNEPLPNWFSDYNQDVMPLYEDIIKAIREVDQRHMIILEGVHWATDWSIFKQKMDDNLMLQFHKYWNNIDTESIQVYLDKREEWNVPIFMGEGGENNKEWYVGAFRLFEDHNISWNFWTWKKIDTDNSPCSINLPEGWKQLVEYLEGGLKPDEDTAERILWVYLNNLLFDKCKYKPEVVASLFRRVPVLIPAVFYGYRGENNSFKISNRVDSNIGFRKNDGMKIQFIEGGRQVPNFQHGAGEVWLADEWMYIEIAVDDWVAYEFTTESSKTSSLFRLNLCVCSENSGALLDILIDDVKVGFIEVNKESWEVISFKENFQLEDGLHKIILKANENSVCVKWLEVVACELY